jgi:hypothetical protein
MMRIDATVQLESSETLPMTPDEAATAIIKALKGDESVDVCYVETRHLNIGSAGSVPPPTAA